MRDENNKKRTFTTTRVPHPGAAVVDASLLGSFPVEVFEIAYDDEVGNNAHFRPYVP